MKVVKPFAVISRTRRSAFWRLPKLPSWTTKLPEGGRTPRGFVADGAGFAATLGEGVGTGDAETAGLASLSSAGAGVAAAGAGAGTGAAVVCAGVVAGNDTSGALADVAPGFVPLRSIVYCRRSSSSGVA